MSLHHDLAWWGVALGVLALLLMFPVGITTTILGPKIQNWWASRSRVSLMARIDNLEASLKTCEGLPTLSDAENIMLRGIEILLWAVGLIPLITFLLVCSVTSAALRFRSVMLIVLVISVWNGYLNWNAIKVGSFRKFRSSENRGILRREIDSLKAKLEKK